MCVVYSFFSSSAASAAEPQALPRRPRERLFRGRLGGSLVDVVLGGGGVVLGHSPVDKLLEEDLALLFWPIWSNSASQSSGTSFTHLATAALDASEAELFLRNLIVVTSVGGGWYAW